MVPCSRCGKEHRVLGGIGGMIAKYVVRRHGEITAHHYACQFECSRVVDAELGDAQHWSGCPGYTEWRVSTDEEERAAIALLDAAFVRSKQPPTSPQS